MFSFTVFYPYVNRKQYVLTHVRINNRPLKNTSCLCIVRASRCKNTHDSSILAKIIVWEFEPGVYQRSQVIYKMNIQQGFFWCLKNSSSHSGGLSFLCSSHQSLTVVIHLLQLLNISHFQELYCSVKYNFIQEITVKLNK